ncbi:endoplasmic reticulum lectin 1-like [Panonychus citri]|uniref:endoplasmic reticulum lectin 1-like n=1 Tax=Panonychus citri TaxID=50023 RepID=UPI0023071227|nr:endoplasmic reticulum lectin 1-like [Panonychus citri]XP_053206120.1 endoplasmic reticulum lectin 1-like [Panonychus citri]
MKIFLFNFIYLSNLIIIQLCQLPLLTFAADKPSSIKRDLSSDEVSGGSEFDAINRAKSSQKDHEKEAFDNFKALNDFYYKINWNGPYKSTGDSKDSPSSSSSQVPISEEKDSLTITTPNKEQYKCFLPRNKPKNEIESKEDQANSLDPYQLLLPLFTREICSFRLEPYWSYELCHGKFIRQFHEESSSQKTYSQEYYLGKFDLNERKENELGFTQMEENWNKGKNGRPTVLIEGVATPYIEINMTGGTTCDLNNRPRFTRVLYVCNDEARNELSSIKETYTCEYEAIVLTPLLCIHPDFRNDAITEESIDCYSLGDSPIKPKGYVEYEVENRTELMKNSPNIDSSKIQFEIHKLDLTNDESKEIKGDFFLNNEPTFDSKLLRDFLTGDYCLHGGTDWWKYEFCYGHKIEQYHEEKGEKKSKILLGKWNLENHIDWLIKNPNRKPNKQKTLKQVSHHYGNGDVCDLTGKPRQVEVKLKCAFLGGDPESVSLYLIEPKSCEYILGVESPLICHLLSTIDENGIMNHPDDNSN